MAVKKESQADVVYAGGFHHKMILRAGVLQDFCKPLVIVANTQVKEFT